MDTFTLIVFLLLVMIALHQELTVIAIALLMLLVLGSKSKGLIAIAVLGIGAGYYLQAMQEVLWVVIAVVIVAVLAFKQGAAGPEAYSPQMLMGG